ncbi:hypothetical protein H2198_000359 [Neophaeococcomyces mojaviensis]|uniref:Uncharacterized protein n=1 Tax=Neophaeococcomyces mojaviensis TaxID=3383035 RepID=A0ACC3AK20_9EURO|nr:hypothetical protein H2198_000359 [Knufia sp. JES_112]
MQYRYSGALIGALLASVNAHTWVEQLMAIAPNGTFVGQPGFPRGNVMRGTPGFGDPAMVNLIPGNGRVINDIRPTDLMCKDSQTTQTQTSGSPRLQAQAGANVALRYQENGHVSLPQNQPGKPDNRGTLYVYGTTQPSTDDKFLSIHRVWNAQGTGGDGRGVLLSTQNFDDSQCYQVNGGTISQQRQKTFSHTASQLMGGDLWCQQDIKIPDTAPSGKPYTLYWVWDWPTMPGTAGFPNGKQEIYTTCMDVDVVAGTGAQNKAVANSFVKGQDLNNAAIAAQLNDIANPTAVVGKSIAFSAASGVPSATDNSGMTFTMASTSAVPVSSQDSSSQLSGFTSFLTETATGNVATSALPATQTSAAATNSRSRPSVAPIGSTSSGFPPQATDGNCSQGSGRGCRGRPNNSAGPSSVASPIASPIASSVFDPVASSAASPVASSVFNPVASSIASSVPTVAATASTGANRNTGTAITTARARSTTTAINTAAPSTITQLQTAFQTVTQTRMETVYTSLGKRDESTATTEAPSTSSTATAACSKAESAYQLRARNPFFILPFNKQPSAGC